MFAGLAFIVSSWFGFSALDQIIPPEPPIITRLNDGTIVEERAGEVCPRVDAGGCAVSLGEKHWAIYYPLGADGHHIRLAELDHVKGLRHAEWQQSGSMNCAQVTVAGNTDKQADEWLCVDAYSPVIAFPNPMDYPRTSSVFPSRMK